MIEKLTIKGWRLIKSGGVNNGCRYETFESAENAIFNLKSVKRKSIYKRSYV